jgi:hypothetical protein
MVEKKGNDRKRASPANRKDKDKPGTTLEKIVVEIQQKMDPKTQVTHNERLPDKNGIMRQCDVVIRGTLGGRPILGIGECKDHSRKKQMEAIDAFAKKCESLNANFKFMVSRKGFAPNALARAVAEGVGCLSLLPNDPKQAGFSVGDLWYGKLYSWTDFRLEIVWAMSERPVTSCENEDVKWQGKPVLDWFVKELYTTYFDHKEEGPVRIANEFNQVRKIEVKGTEYDVKALACHATRICQKKKLWVSWSGDAFYDWHKKEFTLAPRGSIVSSQIDSDLTKWKDFEGVIPEIGQSQAFFQVILYGFPKWNNSKEVVDLSEL